MSFLAASLLPRCSHTVTAAGALRQPCGVDAWVCHPANVSLYRAAAAESWYVTYVKNSRLSSAWMWFTCRCNRSRALCAKRIGTRPGHRSFHSGLSDAEPQVMCDAPHRSSSDRFSAIASARVLLQLEQIATCRKLRRFSAAEPRLLAGSAGCWL